MARPKKYNINSESERELDKACAQIDAFEESVKEMTLDRLNAAPKEESEGHKIAQADIAKSKDHYLKPTRTIMGRDKFNEKFRSAYEFDKQYVHFVAIHNELDGETLDLWTKPYAGVPAEEWLVPTNKPVWGPRYLAEQIKGRAYHRLVMQDKTTSSDGMGQYYGTMAVDKTIQRLDAHPVTDKRSIFMGV